MKELREALGITQEDFARLIGLRLRTLTRWESGQGKPSFNPGQWRKLLAEMQRHNISLDALPDELTPGNSLFLSKGGQPT